MKKLREYLKANRRETVSWVYVLMTGLCMFITLKYAVRIVDSDGDVLLAIAWGVLCLVYLYGIFFKTPGEKELEADFRSTDVKLREAFAELTPEELQAVIDDELRSEETKAVAREPLEKMQ